MTIGLLNEGARDINWQGSHEAIGLVQPGGRIAFHLMGKVPDPDMELLALIELEIDGCLVLVRRTTVEADLPVHKVEGQGAIFELRHQDKEVFIHTAKQQARRRGRRGARCQLIVVKGIIIFYSMFVTTKCIHECCIFLSC